MKKIASLSLAALMFFSCKKDNETFKVRYTVTGVDVSQFKISYNLTDHLAETPFTGTKDTTIYQSIGTVLKLDTKAEGHNNLVGSIYVNDYIVATATDEDTDADNKTQVKIDYTIAK